MTRLLSLRSLLTAALAVVASGALAQPVPGAYVPGYVVADGDTLAGRVALDFEEINARGVWFDGAAGPAFYGTDQAQAYGTDAGRQYRRLSVQTNAEREAPGDQAFVRVVRDGVLDLLAYERTLRTPFFLVEAADGTLTPLHRKRTLGTDNSFGPWDPAGGSDPSRRDAGYRAVLYRVVGACGAPLDLNAVPYTERGVARVVDAYNACQEPGDRPQVAAARRAPSSVSFEITAGPTSGSFQRTANPNLPAGYADPSATSLYGRGALVLDVPRVWPPLSFVLDGSYHRGVIERRSQFNGVAQERIDLLNVGVGVRATARLAGTPVYGGVGGFAGRVVGSDTPVSDDTDGVVRYVLASEMEWDRGLYAEAGVRPLDRPLVLAVRAQTLSFTQEIVAGPGGSDKGYRFPSVSFGVGARF